MKYIKNENDEKKLSLILLCLSVLAGIYISLSIQAWEKETQEIQGKVAMLTAWEKEEKREPRAPFLDKTLQKTSMQDVIGIFEKAGCYVEEIEEDDENASHTAVYHVKGEGNFSQIALAFDIIGEKDTWMVIELREASVKGERIAFRTDIRTYRDRGTYEKKKYRSYRAHGDGEKPGSESIG